MAATTNTVDPEVRAHITAVADELFYTRGIQSVRSPWIR